MFGQGSEDEAQKTDDDQKSDQENDADSTADKFQHGGDPFACP
jgi:hypothetical protein